MNFGSVLAAVAVTGLMTAAPATPAAHADTPNQPFLNQVHSNGVGGQDDTLIAYAHEWCANTGPAMVPSTWVLIGQGVRGNAQFYVVQVAAARAYCPDAIVMPPRQPQIFTGL
jgi:hypothetical protein